MPIQTIEDLTPDPRNARRHTPRNIGVIERSLNEVGAARSIVIDEDGVILAGNATTEAAQQAGITRVRVIEADGNELIAVQRRGLTPEQKVKLALADNRAAELAEWEPDVLAEIAQEMDVSGLFRPDELAELAMLAEPEAGADEPVTIDEAKPTRCQPGDVWFIGPHIVACLDSTDRANVERLVAGRTVGMVWSDAPYGIDVHHSDGKQHGNAITKRHKFDRIVGDDTTETAEKSSAALLDLYPEALHIWWGANHFAHTLPPSRAWIVWDKDTGTNNFADAELAWTNADESVRMFRHTWNGLIKASEHGQSRIHPTQKPIALCEWAFTKYGTPADLIVDPFLGSGPSLKAAHRLGNRTVIGFELSPHYIDHLLEWGEAEGLPVERVSDDA